MFDKKKHSIETVYNAEKKEKIGPYLTKIFENLRVMINIAFSVYLRSWANKSSVPQAYQVLTRSIGWVKTQKMSLQTTKEKRKRLKRLSVLPCPVRQGRPCLTDMTAGHWTGRPRRLRPCWQVTQWQSLNKSKLDELKNYVGWGTDRKSIFKTHSTSN